MWTRGAPSFISEPSCQQRYPSPRSEEIGGVCSFVDDVSRETLGRAELRFGRAVPGSPQRRSNVYAAFRPAPYLLSPLLEPCGAPGSASMRLGPSRRCRISSCVTPGCADTDQVRACPRPPEGATHCGTGGAVIATPKTCDRRGSADCSLTSGSLRQAPGTGHGACTPGCHGG
jgi:hypothetical protein